MTAVGGNYILDLPFYASAAITGKRFVKGVPASEKHVEQADTQGEIVLGVAQFDVTAGQAADNAAVGVAVLGVAVVEAGGTVAQFAEVTTGADGRAEAALVGDRVCGIAITGGAVGEWINILLVPAGRVVA